MKTTLIQALFASVLCIGPVAAQTFIDQQPETVIIRPRGNYTIPRAYDIPPEQRWGYRTKLAANSWTAGDMQRMEGKRIISSRGEILGVVTAIDIPNQLVQVHTPGGVSVALPIVLLQDKGDRLYAPTTSRSQMMAMAVRQTGTVVASDVTGQRVAFAD